MKHTIPLICILLLSYGCTYLPSPIESRNSSSEENTDFIVLSSLEQNSSDIDVLFYPGGLVDPHAYIPILEELFPVVQTIYIAKHDANLAVLDSKKGEDFIKYTTSIIGDRKKVIMGHSLGGAMACSFLSDNLEAFDAAVLMASYPTENFLLTDFQGSVLSLTGTEDAVLDQEKYEEAKAFLPEGETISSIFDFPSILESNSTLYYSIEGGNHAQFGSYGRQSGDGNASISEEDQKEQVKTSIIEFFKAKGWL